jgi:multidrug efflux pump subunit AcrA (membrane-fusion protein)
MLKYITLLLAAGGIFIAVDLVQNQKVSVPASPPLVEPSSAPYADSIGARGLIESLNENVRIAPAVAGLVAEVPVRVGDEVRAGAVLIQQDTRDAEAVIHVQQANVAALTASIAEAEVTLADREDQWDRMEKLGASRVASMDEKQRALFAVRAARSRLESRKADLAAAEAQLSRARVQRELLVVRAPRDGTVLQVNVRAGEYAAPSAMETPILLGRTDTFQLRADVDEDNAPRVRAGCRAVAYIKGQRENAVPLEFVRIEPYILPKKSLSGESTERVDTRVLQVIFRFNRPAIPVYVGQQMDVFLQGSVSSP